MTTPDADEAYARFNAFKAAMPGTHDLVWHVSPTGNRQGIESKGLQIANPNAGLFYTQALDPNHKPGVYVHRSGPLTAYHPDNDNHVFYGGDVYAIRAPRAHLRQQNLNNEQFHEYISKAVPRNNILRVGHQGPYMTNFMNGEPHEFHWGNEESCHTCNHLWSMSEEDTRNNWKNVTVEPNPDGKGFLKNHGNGRLYSTLGENEPKSAEEEIAKNRSDWEAQRGDGFHAIAKTARLVPGSR